MATLEGIIPYDYSSNSIRAASVRDDKLLNDWNFDMNAQKTLFNAPKSPYHSESLRHNTSPLSHSTLHKAFWSIFYCIDEVSLRSLYFSLFPLVHNRSDVLFMSCLLAPALVCHFKYLTPSATRHYIVIILMFCYKVNLYLSSNHTRLSYTEQTKQALLEKTTIHLYKM